MIRLFTTYYQERRPERNAEYEECLRRNLASAVISEIYLLVEGENVPLPASPKIRVRKICRRPQYADYFAWIEELVKPDDVSIIANSDIFFDQQLGLFNVWKLPDKTAFALARWDMGPDGRPVLNDRNDSQDAWIFRGSTRGVRGDFHIGVPRCDNRIFFELQEAGFRVMNPAFSFRSYHLHKGMRVEYAGAALPHFVAPPYRYLWPHNLWTLPRALWHNLCRPACRVGWRFDRRRLRLTLPARALAKLWKVGGQFTHTK